MDGDSGPRKKYDFASHSTGADIGRSRPLHHPQDTSIHRFRESNQSSNSRLPHVDTVAQQNRNPSLHPYSGFEYAESTPYNAPSLQGGSLHSGTLPYQQDFSTSSSRQNPPQTTQQSGHQEQHQHQQQQQHQQQRMQQYDSGMVYNIAPQGQPQSPYDASSHYQPRHSAAIEVLATQFGVPQYYPADDTPAQESAQYLTSQVQQTPYSQAPSTNRSHIATSYPETMPGFNASVGSESVQPSEHRREPSSGLEDAYNQYHQALRQTFENISAGRLNTASRSLLEMSEWLLGNAVDLGTSSFASSPGSLSIMNPVSREQPHFELMTDFRSCPRRRTLAC